jgi:ribonuclease BN (tRNA processing enzyme)
MTTSPGAGAAPARLHLLGTAGGPTPKLTRSAPAQAVEVDGFLYVIDAGNGVARQARLAGLDLANIAFIGITHHHSDHNADIGTLLHLAWCDSLSTPVQVTGPAPMASMINSFFDYAGTDIITRREDEGRPPLRSLIRVEEIAEPGVVFEDERVRISVAPVNHPPMEAYAYRIDTAERSFVISGDTAPCDALIQLSQGADILVHEAIHLPSLAATLERSNGVRLRPHLERSHTSVDDLGLIAAAAGVHTLVVSHLVPADAPITEEQWLGPARRDFAGEVILAHDLMVL